MKTRSIFFAMLGLSLLLILIIFPMTTYAGAELPPRDPPPVVQPQPPNDDDDDDDGDTAPLEAYIVLQGATTDGWGVVQWQDINGDWHDVEGWRGPVRTNSRWVVLAKDFGARPFRWIVKQGPGGDMVGASEPFTLPGGAGETVLVILQ